MSERLHELQRLAGLDAMLFHFNFDSPTCSPCTNGSVDVVPILNIPAGDKRDFAERTARSPLSPKARDMNTQLFILWTEGCFEYSVFSETEGSCPTEYTPKFKHAEPAPAPHTITSAVPSFTSLPHGPSTSSLLLPTFLELSLHLDHLSLQLQRDNSPNDATRIEDANLRTNPRNPIPAFSDPNSPYVPWAPSDREEVLQPLPTTPSSPSSGLVSADSRPYSRSGARAPEPTHRPEVDSRRVNLVRRSWRSVQQVVKKSVRRVVKRIGCFSHSRRTSSPQPSLEPEWEQVSPPIPGSRSTSPRRSSVTSIETNSLATWLAERRRQSLEHDGLWERRMSLAEYERMGSWIHDSGDDSSECSVDEIPITIYNAFSPGLMTFGGNITASSDGRASVLWTLQQLDELGLTDDVPVCIPPPASDHTLSLPNLTSYVSQQCTRRSLEC
ncbi:hypothetical protein IMY05_C4378001700 [Salix suchowensis]|nr:hypothetical protein IMY05_C4378001700 [Salix suchowensis]